MLKGIIVAASHHIEWLLPWWWYHYLAHNAYPVAFFDLGLSTRAKKWCKDRGELLSPSIPRDLVLSKDNVDPNLATLWERLIGSGVWEIRQHWFKKPFVFLASPFSTALWIDLDCEIRAPLSPLFSYADNTAGLSLAREPDLLQEGFRALGLLSTGEVLYNSGIVAFKKESPVLSLWANEVLTNNHLHIGDQEALSRLLFIHKLSFPEIPSLYNWDRGLGPNPDALVFHWHGQKGKALIQEQLSTLSSLPFLGSFTI